MNGPLVLGLLHTVPGLAETFQQLASESGSEVDLVQLIDPSLLAEAIRSGVTPALTERVVGHVRYLVGLGLDAVLVTCSSIGQCADRAYPIFDVPVLRVDRPMAGRAVQLAADKGARHRISVLATLPSTLAPTQRLLAEEKGRAGADVEIRASIVRGAADARNNGDLRDHDEKVRAAVESEMRQVDVVVLAQASMAAALHNCDDQGADHEVYPVPVLSSPASGFNAAVTAARIHRQSGQRKSGSSDGQVQGTAPEQPAGTQQDSG